MREKIAENVNSPIRLLQVKSFLLYLRSLQIIHQSSIALTYSNTGAVDSLSS